MSSNAVMGENENNLGMGENGSVAVEGGMGRVVLNSSVGLELSKNWDEKEFQHLKYKGKSMERREEGLRDQELLQGQDVQPLAMENPYDLLADHVDEEEMEAKEVGDTVLEEMKIRVSPLFQLANSVAVKGSSTLDSTGIRAFRARYRKMLIDTPSLGGHLVDSNDEQMELADGQIISSKGLPVVSNADGKLWEKVGEVQASLVGKESVEELVNQDLPKSSPRLVVQDEQLTRKE